MFCLDVAYICMLQAYVLSVLHVSSGCCIRLVFKCFSDVFSQVFQTLVSSVSSVFFCMLQLLHLDVSKVDRMWHTGCPWEAAGGADDVRGGAEPLLARSLASPTR
jgi:hypothetical protein